MTGPIQLHDRGDGTWRLPATFNPPPDMPLVIGLKDAETIENAPLAEPTQWFKVMPNGKWEPWVPEKEEKNMGPCGDSLAWRDGIGWVILDMNSEESNPDLVVAEFARSPEGQAVAAALAAAAEKELLDTPKSN